ncbi:MAG TPA: cysteine--tRNA ligase [Verrucomicrobiae bacterium]|jgi:cysteinyl-tRNA synthetase|nr:cysteine--tRNA ligase [Verrucomicrobiae bacterium]
MALKFFNTLSRTVEEFTPLDPASREVGVYCCGPTVHDFAHIGNFRTFVFADLVRRTLEFKGYKVRHVMNITDVEDKIIRRVAEAKTSLAEFTKKYEAAFLEDFAALGCALPHATPRATEHIPEIIDLIAKLEARGAAYRAPDGSVYFSIEKYRASGGCYGQLLKLNFEEMRRGERVSHDEYAKESVADFALWKARTPQDGAVFWASPWGEGRPGWHIECSAMSMKLLGTSFDLHLGGEDLIFPHHEDEIAQSEGAGVQTGGRPFVKYWLHGAHLLVEGMKMSKSLGNYFTLRDLLAKGFGGREIRCLLLQAHYRESFNFTMDGLKAARESLRRLDECVAKLREAAGSATAPADAGLLDKCVAALEDDFNVSAVWGAIFEWVRESNRALAAQSMLPERAAAGLAAWQQVGGILGFAASTVLEAPPELLTLLEERQAARRAKDFKRSDAIRDELKSKGWAIEDTAKGPRLKPLA